MYWASMMAAGPTSGPPRVRGELLISMRAIAAFYVFPSAHGFASRVVADLAADA